MDIITRIEESKRARMLALAERVGKDLWFDFEWDDYKLKGEYWIYREDDKDNKYKTTVIVDEIGYSEEFKYIVHTRTEDPWMAYKQYYYLLENEEDLMELFFTGL